VEDDGVEFCKKYANKTSYNSKGQNRLNDKKTYITGQRQNRGRIDTNDTECCKIKHIIQSYSNDIVNGINLF